MTDRYTKGMAAIGGAVAATSTVAPRPFLRLFGVADQDNGAGRLAWRLFAIRTASVAVLAARGDRTARELFLPVQLLDQGAWWWGYRCGEIPLRTAALASAASGGIIALDLARRVRT